MENSCKSLDVFGFKEEEEELAEAAAKRITANFGNPQALDHEHAFVDHVALGTEIQSKETATIIHGTVDVAYSDYSPDDFCSFTPLETEGFANEKMSMSGHVLHNDFKSNGQGAENKSNIVRSGSVFPGVECNSSLGATAYLEDHLSCTILDSSFNDESVRLASDADESMSGRSSSAIADNGGGSVAKPCLLSCFNSSDGTSSENCDNGGDLVDVVAEIVFHPDYIDYCGTHYLDSVVSFSRSFVEVKSKTIYGTNGTFHVHLEIEDIVKIESQWSPLHTAGSISIYFISKDAKQDAVTNHASVSGIQELKFPAVDHDWYRKQGAIESLDVRYKAVWSVLLDTGMENCPALPERESILPRRSYFPSFKKPFDEVIYPKGDPDAVSITKRDIELLHPDTFVNDTIIDFYIKYLKNRQKLEDRTKFHFFNSFFFRKLADMDKDPSNAFDGKAAFQRVRKWTRKVNLLDKDFIFVPVNYNYHWSLLIICYFSEVASCEDVESEKSIRVPCVLHLDSIRGSHMGLKDLMQSYLWEEWKERQKEACQELHSKFRNLIFVSLELPQQENSYDCGLFLLHYVERFLEDVPANFSIHKITSSSNFLQSDWFPPSEASVKRAHIQRLIDDLLDTHLKDCSPAVGSDNHCILNDPMITRATENSVDFSDNSFPLMGCHGNSPCSKFGQGIEMNLLPASSLRSAQYTRSPWLVSKDLFEPGSTSESFFAKTWGDMQRRVSLVDFERPVPLREALREEQEANAKRVQNELAGSAFQHFNGTQGTTIFPCPSEDFRLEPVNQDELEDDSSPASSHYSSDNVSEVDADDECQSVEAISLDNEEDDTRCLPSESMECMPMCFASAAGEMLKAAESHSLVEIHNRNDDNSLFPTNLPELCQEAKQMQSRPCSPRQCSTDCPTFASCDKLDVPEYVSSPLMANPDNPAHLLTVASENSLLSSHEGNNIQTGGVDCKPLTESYEQHVAKRMRIDHSDVWEGHSTALSKDTSV